MDKERKEQQIIKSILKNKNDRRQEELLLHCFRLQNYSKNEVIEDSSNKGNNYNDFNSRLDNPMSSTFGLDDQSFTRRQGIMTKLKNLIQHKGQNIFQPVTEISSEHRKPCTESVKDYFAVLPSFDFFINVDSCEKQQQFFQDVRVGDLVIAVVSSMNNSDLFLHVLCMDGGKKTYLENLEITGICYDADQISYVSPDPENPRVKFLKQDLVRCEILRVEENPQQRLILGMHGITLDNEEKTYKLGAIFKNDLPQEFFIARETLKKSVNGRNFNLVLEQHKNFNCPFSTSYLTKCLGIFGKTYSLMSGLQNTFEAKEMKTGLRKAQNLHYANSYLEAAICNFKKGDTENVFENANKVLEIDQNNGKALVILGGLYRKEKEYDKAVEKFEEALKVQPTYAVAKKHLIGCLLEMITRFQESSDYLSIFTYLIKCLDLQPDHREASDVAHDALRSFDKVDKSSISFERLGNIVVCQGKLKAFLAHSIERMGQPSSVANSTSSNIAEEKKKVVPVVDTKSKSTENTNSSPVNTIKKADSKNSQKLLSLNLHELDNEVAETWNTLNEVSNEDHPKSHGSSPLRNVTFRFDEFANLIQPPVPIIKSPAKEPSPKCEPPPLIGDKKFVMTFTPISKSVQDSSNWDSSPSRSSSVDVNVCGKPVEEKSKNGVVNSNKNETSSLSSYSSTKNYRETSKNKQSQNKSRTERRHRSSSKKSRHRSKSTSRRRSRFRSRSKSTTRRRSRFRSRSKSTTRRRSRFRSRSKSTNRRRSRFRSRSKSPYSYRKGRKSSSRFSRSLSRGSRSSSSSSRRRTRRNERFRSKSRSPVKKSSHQRRSRFSISKSRSPSPLRRSSSRTSSSKCSPRREFIRTWGLPKTSTPSRRSPTSFTPRYELIAENYTNPSEPRQNFLSKVPSPLPSVDYYTSQPLEQNNMNISSSVLPPCPGYYQFQHDINHLDPPAQSFNEYNNQDYYQQPQDFQSYYPEMSGRGKGSRKRGRGRGKRRRGRFQEYF